MPPGEARPVPPAARCPEEAWRKAPEGLGGWRPRPGLSLSSSGPHESTALPILLVGPGPGADLVATGIPVVSVLAP
ncbi:MAG: hypothetical protein EA422_00800 [Gemmatimonadales bacterium]|nr:MAG: hypothetical protein EA422_00800 [Gemmatimonadales bacterium]